MTAKIVHLLGTANVGGTERQLLMLLESLDRARFESEVILFRGGSLEHEFRALARTTVLDKQRPADPVFFARLIRELRHTRADVVQTWALTPNVWGPPAAKLARVQHLVMSHREVDLSKGRGRGLVDALTGRLADVVVCNSRSVAAAAAARGVPPEKLRVISNGVRLDGLSERQRDSHLIVLLGRIDPRKGHDLLIEALPEVVSAVPNARVVFAGPSVLTDEMRYEVTLRARLRELGLEQCVQFVGSVDDPGSLLAEAAVLAAPSRSEGLPNVVLEAMATGTPVVATDSEGVRELVIDRHSGLLVGVDDAHALASALAETLRCPDAAHERARQARAEIEHAFSPEAMVRAWSGLYETLVS